MSIHLESKLAELNQQIRSYPGPIARCDQHLAALLEERSRILEELNRQACTSEALWGHDGGRTND